ncbi:flavin reductase family protein [Nocardiopsis composta]|uniref:Flavin reductase (DIM6/NTAB) family NADH-FMN oxidoreductase RutF n=1 Tax=Nocardiopsis composta TaxID=157465 RepID=A0A7W8QRI8_9ACTN|nr:flavin reductase family protein [Nocardiopsis composta]MBB5435121.1 flavin reductase (DIM6/NTAB) family NADH-FMN oxidoreductase RutF [Nocardiopsis composta]
MSAGNPGCANRTVVEAPPAGAAPQHRPNGSAASRSRAPARPPVDGRRFRDALGRFPTGVVAITGCDPESGRPAGLAANSFTSVSLDPPLVGFCVAHTSTSWPALRRAHRLAVGILGADQEEACRRLAARGGDKFAGLGHFPSPSGAPVLDGTPAWLECSVEAEHPAGDHLIVVARVHHLDTDGAGGGGPLVFYRGDYGGLPWG